MILPTHTPDWTERMTHSMRWPSSRSIGRDASDQVVSFSKHPRHALQYKVTTDTPAALRVEQINSAQEVVLVPIWPLGETFSRTSAKVITPARVWPSIHRYVVVDTGTELVMYTVDSVDETTITLVEDVDEAGGTVYPASPMARTDFEQIHATPRQATASMTFSST